MKNIFPFVLALFLGACGTGGSPDFSGVWDASFDYLNNNCPFTLKANVNELFPMTVTEGPNGTFTVVAANGSKAVGGQGEGEDISFEAMAPVFGDFGSILPYVCASAARVGFLTQGDNEAKITVTFLFSNCASPSGSKQVSTCAAGYHYSGTK